MNSVFINSNKSINSLLEYQDYCEEVLEYTLDDISCDDRFSYELHPEIDWEMIEQGGNKGLFHSSMFIIYNLHRRMISLGEKLYPGKEIEIRINNLIN